MTTTTLTSAGYGAAARSVRRTLAGLHRRYVERRTLSALARLDAHLLRDIGLAGPANAHTVRRLLMRR
jgi:uncharacterized protein YjiS (DUF1127 family)